MDKASIINTNDYEKIKDIGIGASSYVELVKEIKTGKQFAMKYIHNRRKEEFSKTEIDSYIKIDHPAILNFYGYDSSKPKTTIILLEYMPNGSLESVLIKCRNNQRPPNFTQTKKYIILKGIALAMNYLHSQSIIHRDLKTDNILLDENFYPKICDFGISYVSDIPYSKIRMETSVGTPLYKSPEILNKQSYSYKIDVYSFSLIAYELITGKIPFQNCDSKRQIYEYVEQGIRPDLSGLDKYIQEFFCKCWSNDPLKRPTFNDIIEMLNHPSFKEAFQLDEKECFIYESKFVDMSDIDKFLENFEINKAIVEGEHDSIYLYGLIHLSGYHGLYDKNEAIRYIKIAADKGNIDAMFKYACLLNESGDQKKGREIANYYKMAADNGHVFSMFNYAMMLLNGSGIPKNAKEAFNYLKRAADQGNENAIYIYGINLMRGEDIQENLEEAAKYLKKSADLFNVNAMFFYGEMLINGDGVKINVVEGLDYIKRSADQGCVIAMFSYAVHLIKGEDIQTNKKEAGRYFKMAANQGHGEAAFWYARMLYYGNGIPQDKKEAQKYFKIGGDNGFLPAMFFYTLTLFHGLENETVLKLQNKEGIYYLKKLIDSEFPQAVTFFWFQVSLNNAKNDLFAKFPLLAEHDNGSLDMFKKHFPIDMSQEEIDEYKQKCLNVFEKESNKGNEYIMSFYANILLEGNGILPNEGKAYYYLRKLISLGNTEAMVKYGLQLKFKGDLYNAFKYFRMAARLGNKTGEDLYENMIYWGDVFQENPRLSFELDQQDLEVMDEITTRQLEKIGRMPEYAFQNYLFAEARSDFDTILDTFGYGISFNYRKIEDESDDFKLLAYYKYNSKNDDAESLYSYGILRLDNADSIESKAGAVEYIKKAADKGHVKANYRYGKILYEGEGAKKNIKESLKYFKFAADNGNKKAMFYFGKISYEKRFGTKLSGENLFYIQKSADLGCVDAMTYIGQMAFNQKIEDANILEVVNYIKKAAESENPISMFYYGNMLCEGKLVKKNTRKGISYIKKSADLGDAMASLKYGLILLEGIEIPQNEEQAAFYIKKSADKGNEDAILKYGQILTNMDGIFNKKQASIYFKMLADQGNEIAMVEYGKILLEDKDINKKKSAVYYFKTAADLNNKEGMFEYGKMLELGTVIPKNMNDAIYFIKKSADLGCSDAMAYYGEMLYYGKGVQKDKDESMKYLKKSVELGNNRGMLIYALILLDKCDTESQIEASQYFEQLALKGDQRGMYEYGMMLLNGKCVPVNKVEAANYFRKSSELGNKDAMCQYGLMMLKGNGIQKNVINGIEYLKKSADLGNEKAMYKYGKYLSNNSNEIETALYYLKKAANQGYVKSMSLYSIVLNDHHKCDEDLSESKKYMRRAAFLCDANALIYFGMNYHKTGDNENAMKYFTMAYEEGSFYAKIWLGIDNLYKKGFLKK